MITSTDRLKTATLRCLEPMIMSPRNLLCLALVLALPLAACSETEPETTMPSSSQPPTGHTPSQDSSDETSPSKRREIATLGAGCFWCVEAVLEQLDGIIDVTSGYMGGHVSQPTYEQICEKTTGHAEVVQVAFDPDRISYATVIEWFWKLHDPTTKDQQGNDVGPQYRSAIFWHSEAQRLAAEASKKKLVESGVPAVTEIAKATEFWEAEGYHQDYYRRNPAQGYCRFVIAPKLDKLNLKK